MPEYQWKAQLTGLAKDTAYCYRIVGGGGGLLGPGPAPTFRSQVPPGSTTRSRSRCIGDWGLVGPTGENLDQQRVIEQIAASGARFVVTTGDTGLSRRLAAELRRSPADRGEHELHLRPVLLGQAGASIPLFNTQGNHGITIDALTNWPQDKAVASSSGRYQMDTYCCLNGTSSASYPSEWYAFNAGPARIYVLEAAWDNAQRRHVLALRQRPRRTLDGRQRRVPVAASRTWRHTPRNCRSRSSTSRCTRPTRPRRATRGCSGPGNLEGLLADHGVDIVFNGHAHIYERNAPSAAGMPVSYVTGGGGARLEPVERVPTDRRVRDRMGLLGGHPRQRVWCRATPTTVDQVYHYLLVTVAGTQVTVTPTDELGRTFDVQTYAFSGSFG